jgi:hypothetical protein
MGLLQKYIMEKIYSLIFVLTLSGFAWGDIPMTPSEKVAQLKAWQNATCKDEKNLITCSYSAARDDDAEDCSQYRNKPKEFKLIGSKGGASFGEQKYCRIQGKDKE